jgi:hypothetical protein
VPSLCCPRGQLSGQPSRSPPSPSPAAVADLPLPAAVAAFSPPSSRPSGRRFVADSEIPIRRPSDPSSAAPSTYRPCASAVRRIRRPPRPFDLSSLTIRRIRRPPRPVDLPSLTVRRIHRPPRPVHLPSLCKSRIRADPLAVAAAVPAHDLLCADPTSRECADPSAIKSVDGLLFLAPAPAQIRPVYAQIRMLSDPAVSAVLLSLVYSRTCTNADLRRRCFCAGGCHCGQSRGGLDYVQQGDSRCPSRLPLPRIFVNSSKSGCCQLRLLWFVWFH